MAISIIDLFRLNGNNGFRLNGAAAYDEAGNSVSSAGDVNGDGFDDVIIGADEADPVGSESGSSYVVFGKASGFSATINVSGLNGSNGFRLNGAAANNHSGTQVNNAGDINGDGFDDVIIGAPFTYTNGSRSGTSYVVFGKASGFGAKLNLADLDGSNGFRLDGVAVQDGVGNSVSSAGDINGDGFDDLIVGARGINQLTGSSYVVFGKASGFSATLNLSSLNGSNGFRVNGVADGDFSGYSVSKAGDVNGDGFGDLIIGVPRAENGFGVGYVVFGKAPGFDAVLSLTNLNSIDGIRLDGIAGNSAGIAVSDAGDVNGDGFDDLIVGDTYASPNGVKSGASYVVFGHSDFGGVKVIQGTPGKDQLAGTSAAEIFQADAGNDRILGHGGADQFFGDAGNDYIRVSDLDFKSVDGGIGKDTLAMGGSGWNLDLTSVRGKISGIEAISLFGTGDNILTLTAVDVLNLSDITNILRVNGNAGDRIVGLSQGWEDGGIHGNFHTFTSNAAILLVGVNVTTDFV